MMRAATSSDLRLTTRSAPAARALKEGAALAIGVDHPVYSATIAPVDRATRAALADDLAG